MEQESKTGGNDTYYRKDIKNSSVLRNPSEGMNNKHKKGIWKKGNIKVWNNIVQKVTKGTERRI